MEAGNLQRLVSKRGHRSAIGGLWNQLGTLQAEFLKSRGLLPQHALIDVGAGSFRAGVKLVPYLDPGNYYAIDRSGALLNAGYTQEIEPAGLADRFPYENCAVTATFDVSGFRRKFDFGIAQSVFTHVPIARLNDCLAALAPHFCVGGQFLVTVFLAPEDAADTAFTQMPGGFVTRPNSDPFHTTVTALEDVASRAPDWKLTIIGNWSHPRNQQMVCFTRQGAVRTSLPREEDLGNKQSPAMSREEAKALTAGSRSHYSAYVGPPGLYDFMGATQFRLLTTLGLRETHRLLDFGCGSLRAGRQLIPYLLPGHYFGIDPNAWLIEEAIRCEIGADQIKLKNPKFGHNDDFTADHFGVDFDYIIVQSIFSHAGRDLVGHALRNLKRVLAPQGLLAATFVSADTSASGEEFTGNGWIYPGCVGYHGETVLSFIRDAGLHGALLPWYHPNKQKWYVMAHSLERLPALAKYPHLSGAVLNANALSAGSS